MKRALTALAAAAVTAVAVTVGITVFSPAASAASWPTVQRGASGANVYAVQLLLTARGISTEADGAFGPTTEAHVKTFQRQKGLSADGAVGPKTFPKLIVQVKQGSSGSAVKAAQRLLNKYGKGLTVDGEFGPATASATRSFQSSHGLAADGVIGPNTWGRLLTGTGSSGGGGGGGGGSTSGAYARPLAKGALPRSEYDDPHHDYPAIDLPVGTGTSAFAITSGTLSTVSGSCGIGLSLRGDDGAVYTYCHGSRRVRSSGRVSAGDLILKTGNTGNSSGPHLHIQIKTNGVLRCPQAMLLALYDGRSVPKPTSLARSGCSN